jgi:hypothetical protein
VSRSMKLAGVPALIVLMITPARIFDALVPELLR